MQVLEAIALPCADKPSEDTLGHRHVLRNGREELHLWAVDGATPVTDRPNLYRPDMSDPAWFARALSARIHVRVRSGMLTPEAMADILRDLRRVYLSKVEDARDYELPVAALSYVRITPERGLYRFEGTHWADCFLSVTDGTPALRRNVPTTAPYPQPPGGKLTRAPEVVARLQARRALQNTEGVSTALTLDPASAHRGSAFRFRRPGPALVLIGSDGFARPWNEYALTTEAEAAAEVARIGARRAMIRLRAWEMGNETAGLSPKAVDDAAVMTALLR